MNKLTPDEAKLLLDLIIQINVPANIPNRMEIMARVDSCINKLQAQIPEPEDVLELPDAQAAAA